MKNTFTILTAIVCITSFTSSRAQVQSTIKESADKDADEDTTEVVQSVKKKKPQPVLIGIAIGPDDTYLPTGGAFGSATLGWRAGAFAYLPIVGKFCIQPSLYYTALGGTTTTFGTVYTSYVPIAGSSYYPTEYSYTVTTTTKIQMLELPVTVGFRFKRRKHHSYIGIGGYMGYIIGGSRSNTTDTSGSYAYTGSLKIGTKPGDDITPLDYGGCFTTSIEWRGGFSLRTQFHYGLANLAQQAEGATNSWLSTASYGFQLGYLFGKHPHKRLAPDDGRYLELPK